MAQLGHNAALCRADAPRVPRRGTNTRNLLQWWIQPWEADSVGWRLISGILPATRPRASSGLYHFKVDEDETRRLSLQRRSDARRRRPFGG